MVKRVHDEAEVVQPGWGIEGRGLGGGGTCGDGRGGHRGGGCRASGPSARGHEGQLLLALQGPQGLTGGDVGALGGGVYGGEDRGEPPDLRPQGEASPAWRGGLRRRPTGRGRIRAGDLPQARLRARGLGRRRRPRRASGAPEGHRAPDRLSRGVLPRARVLAGGGAAPGATRLVPRGEGYTSYRRHLLSTLVPEDEADDP